MPQCKINGCREPALTGGKQHCAHHRAEYLRRQKLHASRQLTLPICPHCGERFAGTSCRPCDEAAAAQQADFDKWDYFDQASTVEELKSWMLTHMLNR